MKASSFCVCDFVSDSNYSDLGHWLKSKLLSIHTSHDFINPIAYEYNPYITVVHNISLDIWHMAYVFVGNW